MPSTGERDPPTQHTPRRCAVKRRIKQLITEAEVRTNGVIPFVQRRTPPEPQPPAERVRASFRFPLLPDLESAIHEDIRERRLLSYAEAGARLGCCAEKMRLDARGYPVIRAGRTHKIPESVFRLIVRERALGGTG